MTLVKKVKQMVQSLGGAWQQSTGRDEMRRKWAGQTRTDIELSCLNWLYSVNHLNRNRCESEAYS